LIEELGDQAGDLLGTLEVGGVARVLHDGRLAARRGRSDALSGARIALVAGARDCEDR
jgi:hypothetical protein